VQLPSCHSERCSQRHAVGGIYVSSSEALGTLSLRKPSRRYWTGFRSLSPLSCLGGRDAEYDQGPCSLMRIVKRSLCAHVSWYSLTLFLLSRYDQIHWLCVSNMLAIGLQGTPASQPPGSSVKLILSTLRRLQAPAGLTKRDISPSIALTRQTYINP
jgi:hypothetical protein